MRYRAFFSTLILLVASAAILGAQAVPGTPGTPVPTVNGASVTVTWTAPASGGAPTHYLIVAGSTSGASNIGTFNVGLTTTVTAAPGAGTYFIRIIAVNSAGQSTPTAEVSFTIAGLTAPGTPGTPVATVNGSLVTVTWTAPTTGGPPASYTILAGTSSGSSSLGAFNMGLATSVSATLGNGAYFVRMVAVNAAGASAPSAETMFTIGPTSVPGAPGTPVATVNGGTVTVAWTAPSSGGAPTHYLLRAGSSAGASNLGTFNMGAATSITAAPGNGNYFVRLSAVNALGEGPASAETNFTIGSGGPVTNANGTWHGQTSQGIPLSFLVENNQVTKFLGGSSISGCLGAVQTTGALGSVTGTSLTIAFASSGTLPGVSLTGTVNSTQGSGSVTFTGSSSGCPGTGTVNWTATNAGTGPHTVPGAPIAMLTSSTTSSATVSWTGALGVDPTGYDLELGTTSGGTQNGVQTLSAGTSSHTFTGLPLGTYYARVKARAAGGTGPASNEVSFTISVVPGPYDGTWVGTTSQGLPITFLIANSKLTSINITYSIVGYDATGLNPCSITNTTGTAALSVNLTSTGFNMLPQFPAAGLSIQASTSSMTTTTAVGNYLSVVHNAPQVCRGITGTLTFNATKP